MTKITYNGSTYFIPATGDQSWGDSLSAYLVALSTGSLNRSGGIFQITNDVNFGSTNGLVAQYFTARNGLSSSNPASAGSDLVTPNRLRLGVIPNATPSSAIYDAVAWRNNANNADLRLLPHAGSETILNYNGRDLVDVSSPQTLTNKTLPSPIFTGQILADPGSAAAPSYSFSGNGNVGMYQSSGTLGLATNGLAALLIDSSQVVTLTGGSSIAKLLLAPTSNQDAVVYSSLNASSTSGNAYFVAQQASGFKWSMGMGLVGTSSNWVLSQDDGFGTPSRFYFQVNTSGGVTIGASGGTQTHSVNGNLSTTGNSSATNFLAGYATTATAAGTTTLTVSSAQQQYFTGSTTQNVVLPAVSTLVLGQSFTIVNNSTGIVTVKSSGGNTIQAMAGSTELVVTVISTSGTTAASWNAQYTLEMPVNAITALTGDATASGPGSAALTLATVNSNTGSFGSSTAIPSFTVNAKGLITAASTNAVIAPAGTLTGTTLNSTVVNSSLTSVGTLTNLTVTNPISGSITGNAATVTTNANLTGPVTSVGNATTIGAGQVSDANLAVSYIKTDGSRALTGNWSAGAFSATFNSVAVGSSANTISALTSLVASVDRIAVSGNTGNDSLLQVNSLLNKQAIAYTVMNSSSTSGASYFAAIQNSGTKWSMGFDLVATGSTWALANTDGFGTASKIFLQATTAGLVTIGAASGTQTHAVNGNLSATGTIGASNFSGSSSGTNTGDQTITLTGDITGTGTGSFATTLATVNSNVGSFGSSTAIPTFTVNAKGLITAASTAAVIAPAGTLTGTTLASNVVTSSLTTVGTLASPTLTTPTINGGSLSALTTFKLRDTSAAFDVTLAATSSTTLTAGRTLTIDTNNVSSTLKMGANLTVTGATTVNGTFSGTSSGTNTGDQTTISGNAGTATALQTPRAINGVNFDGTAAITVTAAAGTLTGTTLNSTVVTSSLTSVGTLANLTVTNPISGSVTGNAATVTTNANLTGPVTSVGNATTIGSGQVTDANLATSYIKADGSRALTSNWAAGAFSGTFNSVAVGSSANTISGLASITCNSDRVTFTANTGNDSLIANLSLTNHNAIIYSRLASASTTGASYFVAQQDTGTKWSTGFDLSVNSSAWSLAASDGFGTSSAIYIKVSTAGAITLGAASGTQTHTVNGTLSGATQYLADGSVSAPAFAFATDPNTGIYRSASHTLAIGTNGIVAATINATQDWVITPGNTMLASQPASGTALTNAAIPITVSNTNATTNNWAGYGFTDGSTPSSSLSGYIACQFTDRTNHYSKIAILTKGSGGFASGFAVDQNQNCIVGLPSLATNATNGFLYIPSVAGAPTGVPTSVTGQSPIQYDTTNNKLWVYNGAWKGVVLS